MSHKIARGGCVIVMDGYILAVQHSTSGYYGPPKGCVKMLKTDDKYIASESMQECAVRETYEETKIRVLIKDLVLPPICISNHNYYIVRKFSGHCQPDGYEIIGYRWLTLTEFEKQPISKITKRLISQLKEQGHSFIRIDPPRYPFRNLKHRGNKKNDNKQKSITVPEQASD